MIKMNVIIAGLHRELSLFSPPHGVYFYNITEWTITQLCNYSSVFFAVLVDCSHQPAAVSKLESFSVKNRSGCLPALHQTADYEFKGEWIFK